LKKAKLTEQCQAVLYAIKVNRETVGPLKGCVSPSVLAEACSIEGLTRTSVQKKLAVLMQKGLVVKQARGLYRLAPGVRA
jgi:hypothetical protein